MAGTPGSGAFFKTVTCTISSGTITIPSFTLPSTTDALDIQTARYTAVFFDSRGIKRDTFLADFSLPNTLAGSPNNTWAQIRVNKLGVQPIRDTSTYTKTQTDTQISLAIGSLNDASDVIKGRSKLSVAPVSSANPIAVGDNDLRVSSYTHVGVAILAYADAYTSFSGALTAIGSAGGTLVVATSQVVSSNLTIPANVTLKFVSDGRLSINSGVVVTILGPLETPPKWIFQGSGTVSFTDNHSVSRFHPEWWGAVGDGVTDDRDAITAVATAAKAVGVSKIVLLTKTYRTTFAMNLTSASGLELTCNGGGGTNSPSNKRCAIVFDVAGSDPLIDTSSSDHLTISNVELRYVNASFTGDVVGRPNGSTSFGLKLLNVFIGGTLGVATGARSGVNFANCNTCTVDDGYYFYLLKFGVSNFGGSYSNEITIGKGTFDQYTHYGVANPYIGWVFRGTVFEPATDGRTRGIACAINDSGVVDGAGAGAQCVKVSIRDVNFWDDTVSGGINIDYSGSGLTVDSGLSTNGVAGIVKTYIRIRASGNGFQVRNLEFRAANGSIFIDNNTLKARGFCEQSSVLVPESGTITYASSPAHLMNVASCGAMKLTAAQIITRAGLYVGEESDWEGVTVFDTTNKKQNVWNGTAFVATH